MRDARVGPGAAQERALRDEVRQFCEERHLPARARELDRAPAFPWEEFRALGKLGWLGPHLSPEPGRAPWTLTKSAVLLEELAYHGSSAFAKLALQPAFCSVLQHGSEALKARWYRPLFRGEVLVANHITEPQGGSDAGALTARVELVAPSDGAGYVLHGTKSEAAFAADAAAALVYARVPTPQGSGISAFLVPQDLPGVSRELHGDLGERWMRRGTVRYDGVHLPPEALVGEVGQGFRYLQEELTSERALLAVIYLGLARASLDETVEHVRRRHGFGRPLAGFEGISFPLAEHDARWEACRGYVEDVLRRRQEGERAEGRAALGKWLACDTSLAILDDAIQFHGAAGYSDRYLHELRWRDVRSGGLAHGSREVLKMVGARELIGKEALPYIHPPRTR